MAAFGSESADAGRTPEALRAASGESAEVRSRDPFEFHDLRRENGDFYRFVKVKSSNLFVFGLFCRHLSVRPPGMSR